jgi:hypothetical protein
MRVLMRPSTGEIMKRVFHVAHDVLIVEITLDGALVPMPGSDAKPWFGGSISIRSMTKDEDPEQMTFTATGVSQWGARSFAAAMEKFVSSEMAVEVERVLLEEGTYF